MLASGKTSHKLLLNIFYNSGSNLRRGPTHNGLKGSMAASAVASEFYFYNAAGAAEAGFNNGLAVMF